VITRVYLTKWEIRLDVADDEDSRYVWHPLLDVGDLLPQATPEMPRSEYSRVSFKNPSALVDGAPSKTAILAFVTATTIPDSIADITDVYMLPPHILGHKMDDISDEIKAGVVENLALFGVEYADIVGAIDVAEFVDKVELAANILSVDTAVEFDGRESEFA